MKIVLLICIFICIYMVNCQSHKLASILIRYNINYINISNIYYNINISDYLLI